MDFLVCRRGPLKDLVIEKSLENMKDENEAVSKARDMANNTKEGGIVGLFTRDGVALCGWKILLGGKLKEISAEIIQSTFKVDSGSYGLVKKLSEKNQRAHANKQKYRK